jgi:hypothetical protein
VVGTEWFGSEEEEKMSSMILLGDLFLVKSASVFSVSAKRGVRGFSVEGGLEEVEVVEVVLEPLVVEEVVGRGVIEGLKGMMKEGARLREGALSSSCVSLFGCDVL